MHEEHPMKESCHRRSTGSEQVADPGGVRRMPPVTGALMRAGASLLLGLTLQASAQAQASSPSGSDSSVKAVRIVCMAEQMETLLAPEFSLLHGLAGLADLFKEGYGVETRTRAARILKAEYPPIGPWSFFPVATGFVVHHTPDKSLVVTNWHVAAACPFGGQKRVQLGIIEPTGQEVQPILADTVTYDKKTGALVPVRAFCRDDAQPCAVDLPRKDVDGKPAAAVTLTELDRQRKNLYMFAPDVAVLQTRAPIKANPVTFNTAQLQPDTVKSLVLSGFPQVAMRLHQERAGTRRGLGEQITTGATFSRIVPLDNTRPGLREEDVLKADLMLLAAQIHPGNSGGPVVADGAVVGMITATVTVGQKGKAGLVHAQTEEALSNEKLVIPSGYGLAVQAADVVKMLDFLGVPYRTVSAKPAPAPQPQSQMAPPKPLPEPKPVPGGMGDPLILGLIALGVITLVVVGVAIRSSRVAKAVTAPPSQPGPGPSVEQTLVHPAKPEPPPPPAAAKPAARLLAASGPLAGTYGLPSPNGSPSLFVGRDPKSCQLVFPNQTDMVSSIHCCFSWTAQTRTLTVRDMSMNGTYVNGKRVEKGATTTLRTGDTVDLGGANLNRFVVDLS